MCGIAGFVLNKNSRGKFPATRLAEQLLLNIDARGGHATGFMALHKSGRMKNPKLEHHRLNTKADEFLRMYKPNANTYLALLHTRFMTKGDEKVMSNNHPVKFDNCYVIHNGSIRNDDALVAEYKADRGQAQVDSIAIPISLTHHGIGEPADIKASLHALQGSFAIAACEPTKNADRVILAKGESSPLVTLTNKHGIFWASTKDAIVDAWSTVLGTPPAGVATNPGDEGFKYLQEGQYWVVNAQSGEVKITPGVFEVNRPAYSGYHWRRYTAENHDWTCWPTTKDCVFGKECGNCDNRECTCYEGNPLHPRLDDGLVFKQLCTEHTEFKRHADKFKLTEDAVNPIQAGTSCVARPTIGTQTTLASTERGSGSNGSTDLWRTCFFCRVPHKSSTMEKLEATVPGTAMIWRCPDCESEGFGGPVQALDPALGPIVRKVSEMAEHSMDIVLGGIRQTAFELSVDPNFVQYYCLVNRQSLEKNKSLNDFITEVRSAFKINCEIVQEYRKESTK